MLSKNVRIVAVVALSGVPGEAKYVVFLPVFLI